ncbi:uncharacterized protein TNCV_380581 [Trichonephila clavipes]|nr:uncharacterized protein TNCV_380581 [Trichonephila clavipes]
MTAPSSSFIPTHLSHADNQRERHPRGFTSHFAQRDLIYRTPRAQDWYQIFGSALVQNTDTDFGQLKEALSKAFPAIRNKKELEIKFYMSQKRRDQEPKDFAYDLLKLNKKLNLGMSEKALVDHIFVRLEPQVQDYVEVRNPQNTFQLLEVLSKFERRMSNAHDSRRKWRNSEVGRRPSNGRNDYRGNYENSRQGNQWFDSRKKFQKDDRRFNDRGYQFRNGGQKDDFSRVDRRNRGSSENFSRDDRRQMRRLNVLKVSDVQSDQTLSADEVPIKLSAIYMSPVELPYVPILLNDTFKKALWGGEVIYIGGDIPNFFLFYKQVKISRAQVITAQGDKCQNIGIVDLNVRIREFEKPWLFHVLADLEYPCILGEDFISGSKIILDFDRKSLVIPDSQIDTVVKTIEEGKVEVDLSKTSDRLGIRYVKTVVYRPQANRTERVNRDLVQMIANYVNDQRDKWDQFLREFAYAIRTAVNETTKKTPAE